MSVTNIRVRVEVPVRLPVVERRGVAVAVPECVKDGGDRVSVKNWLVLVAVDDAVAVDRDTVQLWDGLGVGEAEAVRKPEGVRVRPAEPVRLLLREPVHEHVLVGAAVAVHVADPEAVAGAGADVVAESEGPVSVGVNDRALVHVRVCAGVGDGGLSDRDGVSTNVGELLREVLPEALQVRVPRGVCEAVEVRVAVGVGPRPGLDVRDSERERLYPTVPVTEFGAVPVPVCPGDAVHEDDGDTETERVPDRVVVVVGRRDGVRDGVADAVQVEVPAWVGVRVSVEVRVACRVGVLDGLWVWVGGNEGVALAVGVAVSVGSYDPERDGTRVRDMVQVPIWEALRVAPGVPVRVPGSEYVAVSTTSVGECEGVLDGVAVRSIRVWVSVREADDVGLEDRVGVAGREAEAVRVRVSVPGALHVPDEGVLDGRIVGLHVAVPRREAVGEAVGVRVRASVCEALGEYDRVRVDEPERRSEAEQVVVRVAVNGLTEAVAVGEAVKVRVGISEGECEAVAVGGGAKEAVVVPCRLLVCVQLCVQVKPRRGEAVTVGLVHEAVGDGVGLNVSEAAGVKVVCVRVGVREAGPMSVSEKVRELRVGVAEAVGVAFQL